MYYHLLLLSNNIVLRISLRREITFPTLSPHSLLLLFVPGMLFCTGRNVQIPSTFRNSSTFSGVLLSPQYPLPCLSYSTTDPLSSLVFSFCLFFLFCLSLSSNRKTVFHQLYHLHLFSSLALISINFLSLLALSLPLSHLPPSPFLCLPPYSIILCPTLSLFLSLSLPLSRGTGVQCAYITSAIIPCCLASPSPTLQCTSPPNYNIQPWGKPLLETWKVPLEKTILYDSLILQYTFVTTCLCFIFSHLADALIQSDSQ